MACSCNGRKNTTYRWTSEDGNESQVYATEIQARAKQIRDGGSWAAVDPNESLVR